MQFSLSLFGPAFAEQVVSWGAVRWQTTDTTESRAASLSRSHAHTHTQTHTHTTSHSPPPPPRLHQPTVRYTGCQLGRRSNLATCLSPHFISKAVCHFLWVWVCLDFFVVGFVWVCESVCVCLSIIASEKHPVNNRAQMDPRTDAWIDLWSLELAHHFFFAATVKRQVLWIQTTPWIWWAYRPDPLLDAHCITT